MNETKKTHRFNVVDLIIVIVLIGCVVGIVLREYSKTTLENGSLTEDGKITVYATAVIPYVENEQISMLQTGQDFEEATDDGGSYGTLYYYSAIADARERYALNDGRQYTTVNPKRKDVYCVLEFRVTDTEFGYLIDNRRYLDANSAKSVTNGAVKKNLTVLQVFSDSKLAVAFADELASNPKKYDYQEGSDVYARVVD